MTRRSARNVDTGCRPRTRSSSAAPSATACGPRRWAAGLATGRRAPRPGAEDPPPQRAGRDRPRPVRRAARPHPAAAGHLLHQPRGRLDAPLLGGPLPRRLPARGGDARRLGGAYADEIPESMDVFDRMVGRLLAWVDKNRHTELVVASSLGQAAVDTERRAASPRSPTRHGSWTSSASTRRLDRGPRHGPVHLRRRPARPRRRGRRPPRAARVHGLPRPSDPSARWRR